MLLSSSYSNAQDVDPVSGSALNSTGNVLNLGQGLPWSGTVAGAAGGFSGGPGPAYNSSTGNIIFSYGLNTASQMVAINTALANAGTGIQLAGYRYSWQINNDLYGGGNRGTLTGNVSLTGSAGNVLESFNYDYNQNLPSFTTFSGTQFFENRYSLSAVSNLTVSFTGKDQTWWAGYYGPRVHVDNLSLLYTAKPVPVVTDPCITDPLSSPSCPGYALATVKNSLLGSTVSNASATSYVPTSATSQPNTMSADTGPVAGLAQDTGQPQAAQQSSQPQQSGQQQQTQQDPAQSQAVAQMDPAQPAPSGSPQPAGGPPQQSGTPAQNSSPPQAGPDNVAGKSNDGPKMSASQLMSIVKTAQDKDKATQQMAVQNAAKVVEGSTQQSQATATSAINSLNDMSANSASAAAQFATQTTQASSQTPQAQQGPQQTSQQATNLPTATRFTAQTQQTQDTQQIQMSQGAQPIQMPTFNALPSQELQSTSLAMLKPPSTGQMDTNTSASSGTGLTVRNTAPGFSIYNQPTTNMQSSPPPVTMQFRNENKNVEVETPQLALNIGIGKPGNSWGDLLQSRTDLTSNTTETRSETVKKNVEINELAGGVDITLLALQPRGYDLYSVVLKDAAFYAPKDIYGNQKTVDNARALRQLSSDRLHQEMIDQQYKGK